MPKRKSDTQLLDDHLSVITFLGDILGAAQENARHIDNQINILVGLSTAIFLFAVTQIKGDRLDIVYLVLAIASSAAVVVSLLGIHPPRFSRKHGQPESLMYNKRIITMPSYENYWKHLGPALGKRHEMARQYAIEIYNIYRFYYRPKRRLFHWARNVLIYGMAIAAITFLITHFTGQSLAVGL